MHTFSEILIKELSGTSFKRMILCENMLRSRGIASESDPGLQQPKMTNMPWPVYRQAFGYALVEERKYLEYSSISTIP